MLYRQCVCDANNHQEELERVKQRIIVHIRKLICQGDNVLKEVGTSLQNFTHLIYCFMDLLVFILLTGNSQHVLLPAATD